MRIITEELQNLVDRAVEQMDRYVTLRACVSGTHTASVISLRARHRVLDLLEEIKRQVHRR